jgi:hypothetical protein
MTVARQTGRRMSHSPSRGSSLFRTLAVGQSHLLEAINSASTVYRWLTYAIFSNPQTCRLILRGPGGLTDCGDLSLITVNVFRREVVA